MTATIPVDKFEAEDKPVWLDDDAIRGSMVKTYGRQPGVIKTEFAMSGPTIRGIGGPASGGTLVKTVMEGEITFKRELDVVFTGQLSQNPYIIQRGPVTVGGKLRFIAADESPYTTMLLNTQPQLQWIL